jgi:folate-dependent tRNA-U54 methylase TrmFO/GidA
MNANFGLVDELSQPIRDKQLKRQKLADRALAEMGSWIESLQLVGAEESS